MQMALLICYFVIIKNKERTANVHYLIEGDFSIIIFF